MKDAAKIFAATVLGVLVGCGMSRLYYGPGVEAAVAPTPDPRPAAAYREVSDVVRDNQHDANSAHARIDALVWQMHIVARTCPGRARPPSPPWPVVQPLARSPWTPKPWRLLR